MKTYGVGTKVYIDSYAGMLKGIVTQIVDSDLIVVKITSKSNRVYKAGEKLFCNHLHTFPRDCYHMTGIFTYRVDDFTWSVEE